MSVTSPIDINTPAVARRKQLAMQLQQQYNQNGHQAIHAMPLYGGGGPRDSTTLPGAPQPQLTTPYMQNPGLQQALGVVGAAGPGSPNVSPGPGQASPGFNPGAPQQPTSDPNAPQPGQGAYGDGSPIMDPGAANAAFGPRRLFDGAPGTGIWGAFGAGLPGGLQLPPGLQPSPAPAQKTNQYI